MAADFSHEFAHPFDHAGENGHGVLLIHGFSGSPAHMRPMADALAKAGFTVKTIALRGHRTSVSDMARYTWKDWLEDARQAFDALVAVCDKVSVAGLSMGGDLTLILAAEKPVHSAISICAPMRAMDWRAPFAGLFHWLMPYQPWADGEPVPGMLTQYELGYPGVPTRKVADLQHLMRLARTGLGRISCPLLVVEAGKDDAIHPSSVPTIMRKAGSRRVEHLFLPQSPHVCTIGPECETLFKTAIKFLQNS